MKRKLCFILTVAVCLFSVSALAASSPMLESFAGSGIKKKEPAGKLQKTLLSVMRKTGSTRLADIITENDSFVDAEGNAAPVRDAEIEVIFTPDVYRVKKDGTADFIMQLADVRAFSEKEAAVVVGIPQGTDENAGVKYIEIPAEVRDGKVQAVFPAWAVAEMRHSISSGWNCVCLVVSRDYQPAPDGLMFEIPAEEDAVSV